MKKIFAGPKFKIGQTLAAFYSMALLVVMSALLGACGQNGGGGAAAKPNANASSIPGQGSQVPGNTPGLDGIQITGAVTDSANDQEAFDKNVRNFMSSAVNPKIIGYVGGQLDFQSGVFIGGRVPLTGGSLKTGDAVIGNNGEILIQVQDNTGKPGAKPLPPIKIVGTQGTISGNSADIEFIDPRFGTVHMNGTFDANTFSGTIDYTVTELYDKSQTSIEGNLGSFSVPTCKFFVCR